MLRHSAIASAISEPLTRSPPFLISIANEPVLLEPKLQDEGRAEGFLASTAVFLAQKHHLPLARWVSENSRDLERP